MGMSVMVNRGSLDKIEAIPMGSFAPSIGIAVDEPDVFIKILKNIEL